jgi:hypothetical protein
MITYSREVLEKLAYFKWLTKGKPDNSQLADWIESECILNSFLEDGEVLDVVHKDGTIYLDVTTDVDLATPPISFIESTIKEFCKHCVLYNIDGLQDKLTSYIDKELSTLTNFSFTINALEIERIITNHEDKEMDYPVIDTSELEWSY